MSSVPCVLWSDCSCENVACGRCICLHLRSNAREFTFRQATKEDTSELRNYSCSVQDEDRQEFQLLFDFQSSCSSHCLTRTNLLDSVTGFPVTSNDRSSILFGHRIDHHFPQVLQIGDSFAFFVDMSFYARCNGICDETRKS